MREELLLVVHDDTSEARVHACREIMTILRPVIVKGECDIPWANRDRFPADVAAAATRLRGRFVSPGGHGDYMQSGIISPIDDDTWLNLVAFVPYALDATFWDSQNNNILSLADESDSIISRLTKDEQEQLRHRIPGTQLHPV
jgi:hypothetical protein